MTLFLSVRVVGTDPRKPSPQLEGHAEILNSGLEELEEVTVCARLRTHQFEALSEYDYQALITLDQFGVAASYTALPCDTVYPGCTEYMRGLVPGWGHGRTFGASSPDQFFPSWPPGKWTSYCFTASSSLGQAGVFINGLEVTRAENYEAEEEHRGSGKNIRLMNSIDLDSPAHGSLTELTVWSRVLSERELTDWAACGTVGGETVVDWDTAELEVKGLQVEEVDRAEICSELRRKDQLLVFDESRTFDGILSFCANLGGQIAVSRDNSSYRRMVKQFSQNCPLTEKYFYSGHTDREEPGVWRDANTGQEMSWLNWGEDQPTSLDNDDCAFVELEDDGKIFNYDCLAEAGNIIFCLISFGVNL